MGASGTANAGLHLFFSKKRRRRRRIITTTAMAAAMSSLLLSPTTTSAISCLVSFSHPTGRIHRRKTREIHARTHLHPRRQRQWQWKPTAVRTSPITSTSIISTSLCRQDLTPEPEQEDNQQPSYIVPLFPLQKSIKLPGETLTLNLYEERYLAFADWILEQAEDSTNIHNPHTTKVFGALYTADKPQIISQHGYGPIVPMIQTGDIGVLFSVETFQDSMVPTMGGIEQRRRIRIQGTGMIRFQVQEILSNGWEEYHNDTDHKKKRSSLPFILAKVTLYTDILPSPTSVMDSKRSLTVAPAQRTGVYETAIKRGIPLPIRNCTMDTELASFLHVSQPLLDDTEKRKQALHLQSTVQRLHLIFGDNK
jgi:hypothetical protein